MEKIYQIENFIMQIVDLIFYIQVIYKGPNLKLNHINIQTKLIIQIRMMISKKAPFKKKIYQISLTFNYIIKILRALNQEL